VTSVLWAASIASLLFVTIPTERAIERYVNDGVRKPLALYLAGVVKPTGTVGAESAGFNGYYSNRVVEDFPGLCSRKVVSFLRTHPGRRSLMQTLEDMRPDYIVLRPYEYEPGTEKANRWLFEGYSLIKVFAISPEAYRLNPRLEDNQDAEFHIFRRNQP
jgi:hypothetical protein